MNLLGRAVFDRDVTPFQALSVDTREELSLGSVYRGHLSSVVPLQRVHCQGKANTINQCLLECAGVQRGLALGLQLLACMGGLVVLLIVDVSLQLCEGETFFFIQDQASESAKPTFCGVFCFQSGACCM